MRKLRRALYSRSTPPTSFMWWTADSPIRKPIPANPTVDPDNATIISYLASRGGGTMDCTLWGAHIYHATESTRRVPIARSSSLDPVYGALATDGWTVPVDPAWRPAPEDDAHISIIDTNGTEYSFWRFVNGASPQASGAGIVNTQSDTITSGYGGATAAKFARAAGMVRVEEWERGYIDHALFMATSLTRTGSPAPYRFPALASDGKNLAGAPYNATLTIGARLQLDPTFDVDAKTAWKPWQRMVAKALQQYGMYVGDTSGNICGLVGEIPQTSTGYASTAKHNNQTMYDLGITDQYPGLPSDFPWSSMRVLAKWDDTVPDKSLTKLSALVDTFPGPGLDRAYKWKATNCVAVKVTVGAAEIPQTAEYANALTSGLHDATESAAYARVSPALGGNGTYTTTMLLMRDTNNSVELSIAGSSISFAIKTGGTTTRQTIGTYDSVAHAWLRIREAAGVFYGDTSADGITWTTQKSAAHSWQADTVSLRFLAGNYGTESPASSYVRSVNTTN